VAVVELRLAGASFCSGTAIAPHVVLTAAHCVDALSADTVWTPEGGTSQIVRIAKHPTYDPSKFTDDLALLLTERVVAGEDADLIDDDSSLRDGVLVEVVGFGCTEAGMSTGVGVRRSGLASVAVRSNEQFTLVAGPALPCGGDSGGPIIIGMGDAKRIVGVISHSDSSRNYVVARTVADALDSFIRPFIAEASHASVALGRRCSYDEQCQTGTCYVPPDAPGVGYCTHECRSTADCSVGTCLIMGEVGTCAYPLPSPGALDAKCIVHEDCSSGQCGKYSIGSSKRCTTNCFKDGSLQCPSGYECLPNMELVSYGEACFKPGEPETIESSGSECAIVIGASPPACCVASIEAIAALALCTRRRRRELARKAYLANATWCGR